MEPLEERRLLSLGVAGTDPAANATAAPVTADVATTFTAEVNPATVSQQTYVVHAETAGKLLVPPAALSAAGATVTLNPAADFRPGDLVSVTATTGLRDTGGQALTSGYVWQFRTAASGGFGRLIDSRQDMSEGDTFFWGVDLGDLDGDGDLDVFASSDAAHKVYLNDGAGNYADSGQALAASGADDVVLGDLDGDGDLDAYVAGYDFGGAPDTVWINDGTGHFSDSGQSLGNDVSYGVALGDLDGDGDLDVFTANAGNDSPEPNKVWINDGTGHFAGSGQSLGSGVSTGVALGDVDGDGDLDAFVTNTLGGRDELWLNNGGGLFTNTGQALAMADSRGVALGDLDGDGDLDAFVADGAGSGHSVWLNDGAGTFADSGQALGTALGFGVTLGDLDGDGDLDAVVLGDSPPMQAWINDGAGQFAAGSQDSGSAFSVAAALGDVDADGDLDAVVSQGNLIALKVWRNEAGPSETDYGDAPDGPYPTLAEHGGASHTIVPGFYLGASVDGEADGQPTADADGDDLSGLADDDGVMLDVALMAGRPASLTVYVTDQVGSGGYVDAWIDLDQNGDWLGAGEHMLANQPVAAGANRFQFDVPSDATPGMTYARVRLSSGGNLAPGGHAADGEVEDYRVEIFGAGSGAIFGQAFLDEDSDGQRDTFEAGLDGVVVQLFDDQTTGQLLLETVTTSIDLNGDQAIDPLTEQGLYAFTGLPARRYRVVEWPADGNQPTLPPWGEYVVELADGQALGLWPGLAAPTAGPGDGWVGSSTAGQDEFFGSLALALDLPDSQGKFDGLADETVYLAGSVLVARGDPQPTNPPEVATEIVADGLAGYSYALGAVGGVLGDGSADLASGGPQYSAGLIRQQAGDSLRADSFFDIFLELELPDLGMALHNETAVPLAAVVDRFVPYFTEYASQQAAAIALVDSLGQAQVKILGATLVPQYGGDFGNGPVIAGLDFGDAPDPAYATLLAEDGARHGVVDGFHLGAAIDAEADGQPTAGADGDDAQGEDDEDGVVWTSDLVPGQAGSLVVTLTDASAAGGYLDAWIDLDHDGSWTGDYEQFLVSQPLWAGVNPLQFVLPATAAVGETYVRFRLSSSGGLGPDGWAPDGEVEDYRVLIDTPPLADPGGPYVIDVGEGLLLDGSNSIDPDELAGDSIVSYEWDLDGDGQFDDAAGPQPQLDWGAIEGLGLAYPADPVMGLPDNTIRLRVTDSFGIAQTGATKLVIYDNRPFAAINVDPVAPLIGEMILFDGSGSYHGRPDRSIVSYEWDFDYDGTTFNVGASGVVVVGSYDAAGPHTVALRVTDDNSPPGTAIAQQVIDVSSGPLGDFNGDNAVNHFDLALWIPQRGIAPGEPGYDSRFDLTGDTLVDQADLDVLLPRLYQPLLPSGGEPAGIVALDSPAKSPTLGTAGLPSEPFVVAGLPTEPQSQSSPAAYDFVLAESQASSVSLSQSDLQAIYDALAIDSLKSRSTKSSLTKKAEPAAYMPNWLLDLRL